MGWLRFPGPLILLAFTVACTSTGPRPTVDTPGDAGAESAVSRPLVEARTEQTGSAQIGSERIDPAAVAIIEELCRRLIADRHTPGAVLAVGRIDADGIDRLLMERAYGTFTYSREGASAHSMTVDTLFDLASLTKPTATASAAMFLVQDGVIALDDPVARHLPAFAAHDKGDITVLDLLTHTSGLAAYDSVAEIRASHGPRPNPDGLTERLCQQVEAYPTGTGYRYSCLNYLTLARLVQDVSGKNMEALLRARLWGPLGMRDTTFYPSAEQLSRTAPTIGDDAGGIVRRGEVHDPLAYYSASPDFAPGNAGVFSTVGDLRRYVRLILNRGWWNETRVFREDIWRGIVRDQVDGVANCDRTCGWGVWTSDAYARPCNRTPETACLGHTGYTGTIVWMDQYSGAYVILLTNCVYPDDTKAAKKAVIETRRRIIRTVLDHLRAPEPSTSSARPTSGSTRRTSASRRPRSCPAACD